MENKAKWESIGEAEFDGDVLITDPCYLPIGSDERWNYKSVKAWIEDVGGLVSNTFYGDWGCTLYQTDGKVGNIENPYELGHFCADAGLVCVVPMESVRSRYPGFDAWHEDHAWLGAIVNDFKGTVRLMKMSVPKKFSDGTDYEDVSLRVRGDGEIKGEGKISFESMQTEA
jgi:hypothetical protein